MTRTPVTLASLLVATLLFSACQPPQPGLGSGGRASATGVTPASQSTGRLPGELSAGLDKLDSYRAGMTMVFDGSREGQPLHEELVWTEEVVRQPAALRVTYSSQADRGDLLEIISAGGQTYTLFDDECLITPVDGDPKTLIGFDPSAFFGSLSAQGDLGVETIDGVPARHYQADTTSLGFASGFTDARADLWVAEPGDYIVRYVFEGNGSSANLFGRGDTTPGAVRIEYQVGDVNQAIAISAPDGCGLSSDLPLMPDAAGVSSVEDLIGYSTTSAVADVVAFYRRELPAVGWIEDASAAVLTDNFSSLTFEKDGRTAVIVAALDASSNATNVLIQVSGE